ncbi:MAG TPA: glycosyltransferase [Rhodospirillales bacterium]|nr:glycosyltransferase [Rhodospirillales bacterium]
MQQENTNQLADWAEAIGVVVIGRNEGERLRRCLNSLLGSVKCLVYVDSGSTDDSVEMARSLGSDVVDLDISKPFTAARARNMGFERLHQINPDLSYVQFVDGDCEVVAGWIETAVKFLNENDVYAVTCGRRRERYPERTIYNRLCDMEWDSPVGDVASCGGDTIIRVQAFDEVGGYNPVMIAGEEPEMCYRLRQKGWKICRLDHEMTLHDADMTRLSQWWNRTVRSGHAYAQGQARHGHLFSGYYTRNVWSVVIWGLIIPVAGIAPAYWTQGLSLLVLLGYGILWWRVHRHRIKRGDSAEDAMLFTNFIVAGKFPQVSGVLKYWKNRLLGRVPKIIEYK